MTLPLTDLPVEECVSQLSSALFNARRAVLVAPPGSGKTTLANELGPRGIRVNALLPGIVEGERQNRVIEAKAKVKNISFDDMKNEILSGASLNRFVTHEDLAEQAHFLCSPLGRNISGQAVSVCGNIEKSG